MTTQQLIPVVPAAIGSQTVQTVDGRALHTFLEVQTHFRDWIDRRIEEYSFEEDKDFRSFLSESTGGRPTKEYALALDMAKELAMVERTAKGKQARQYFIECEKRLHVPGAQPTIDPLAAQLAQLLKGKVLVDYGTLGSLARVLYAASGLLKDVEHLGVDLEKQCGKPLIRFDLPASRPAPSRHTPLSRVQEDVLAQIRVSGRLGITTYELSRRPPACRLSSTDLHRVLATLEEQKKIILVNVRAGKPGKKREAWVALDPNETRQHCESEDVLNPFESVRKT